MSKFKYITPLIVVGLFILGYYHPVHIPAIFDYTRVPFYWIFLVNFSLIGIFGSIPIVGTFLVGAMAHSLGSQLPLIFAKYSNIPAYQVLLVLSIHGIFEIISMAISFNTGIELITKPNWNRLYKNVLVIAILLFIGSLLEHFVSYSFFEYFRSIM